MTVGKVWNGSAWITFGASGLVVPSILGSYGSGSSGVFITTPAVALDWSAWVEIDPEGLASDWLTVSLGSTSVGLNNTVSDTLMQFATGAAGSEVAFLTVVASNLPLASVVCDLPVSIPAGRFAVRIKSARVNLALSLNLLTRTVPYDVSTPVAMGINELTADGVALSIPAINDGVTWGPWTEITAATSHTFRALHVAPTLNGDTSVGVTNYRVDIGVGPAGAEVSLGQVYRLWGNTQEMIFTHNARLIPASIPAGSRVSARFARSNNNEPLALALHGVPV